jgi:hypothetical protein
MADAYFIVSENEEVSLLAISSFYLVALYVAL